MSGLALWAGPLSYGGLGFGPGLALMAGSRWARLQEQDKLVEDLREVEEELGEHVSPLSQDILSIFASLGDKVTMGDFLSKIEQKGFGFLLVILGLPAALPGASPVAIPFGVLMLVLSAQILAGRDVPLFPDWVRRRELGGAMRGMLVGSAQVLAKLERVVKPRWGWVYGPGFFRWVTGPMMLVLSVSFFLPLLNTPAGLAVMMVGLGMLEEDGVVGLGGLAVSLGIVALTFVTIWFLVVYGPEGIERMRAVFGR